MRKPILTTLFSLALVGQLIAADAPDNKAQLEKITASRTRVTAKMNDLVKLSSANLNGIGTAANTLQTAYSQAINGLQKRVAEENAKPADTRDTALIETLNGKVDRDVMIWNTYSYKEIPTFNIPVIPIQDQITQLNAIVLNLPATLDQAWARSNMDLEQLNSLFVALDKRIDDLTVKLTPIIENYKKTLADHEHTFQE